MRRVPRIILGTLSMAVGLAGLVLPILQGWFFIAIGALLLAPDVPVLARLIRWVETKYPLVRRSTARLRHLLREKPRGRG